MLSLRPNRGTTGSWNCFGTGFRLDSTRLAAAMTRGTLILAVSAALSIAALPVQAQSGPYGVASPAILNFRGAVAQTSPPQVVSLKNTGDSELTFSNISTSGDFAITTNYCENGVKAGTHCNVYVAFTPSGPGTETGTLTFLDNASNSPQTVSLSGTIGEIVLYNFAGSSDGLYPESSLTFDSAGNLYGTTTLGGPFGNGTIYELSPNGNGGWNKSLLYAFTGAADGGYPTSNLVFDSAGNLYGKAYGGGAYGYGVVFELSLAEGNWAEAVLYNFASDSGDEANPGNLIMDPAGNLYGTIDAGVFELTPSVGGWTNQMIFSVETISGLTMDAAGNIFGTGILPDGWGTYQLSPNGNGAWNPTTLHIFAGVGHDGDAAWGTPVADLAGNVFGTTCFGGTYGGGIVYKLRLIAEGKNKGLWIESILHSFKGGLDGACPMAGLALDAAGNIYGSTMEAGYFSYGTVFELASPQGKRDYKEKLLWSFNGADGEQPYSSLILDGAGNLYGAGMQGGANTRGIIFEVIP